MIYSIYFYYFLLIFKGIAPLTTAFHENKVILLDFPGGSGVKNLPDKAGDGFDPWSRKIPHATKQLRPCATTTEPVL